MKKAKNKTNKVSKTSKTSKTTGNTYCCPICKEEVNIIDTVGDICTDCYMEQEDIMSYDELREEEFMAITFRR